MEGGYELESNKLIKYWSRRANYLNEELDILAEIYKERCSEFTFEESEVHKSMTGKYIKHLEMVQATIEALEGLNEQE